MPAHRSVLVLFDIDGTLIHTAGAGVRGMSEAFERLHGRTGALDGVTVAGRTDRAILAEIFGRWNQPLNDEIVAGLREGYLEHLERELWQEDTAAVGVLPGVGEALDALESDPSFVVGLLTGNFERGAELKLSRFDLWHRFELGAFGDYHVDRRDLVPVALARARASGLEPQHVVVIGDTPLDVDCAHANGAHAVAVATGGYSRTALVATGAEIVVDTLDELCPINRRLTDLCTA